MERPCVASLRLKLSGQLLNLNHHELGGKQRCESHQDVHNAAVNARLRIVLRIALYEVRLLRTRSLECPFQEQSLHKRADVETNLSPELFVVGFKHHPLS